MTFTNEEVDEISSNSSASKDILAKQGITFKSEDALIISEGYLSFNLRTIHFSPEATDRRPECYLIKVNCCFCCFGSLRTCVYVIFKKWVPLH